MNCKKRVGVARSMMQPTDLSAASASGTNVLSEGAAHQDERWLSPTETA